MAGHSKWANIKHRKAKVDAQKGAAFAKYSREIFVSAKAGGVDPFTNFRLRTAIDRAKSAGLPNDTIKRIMEKAAGTGSGDNYEEITYEGYGPGGVAVFIETMTDNRNRTAGDLRSYFNKNNGNLGENGCVGWIFKQEGSILIDTNEVDSDKLFEDAINAGAEDFIAEEEQYRIVTSPDDLQTVVEALESVGYEIKQAEITRTP